MAKDIAIYTRRKVLALRMNGHYAGQSMPVDGFKRGGKFFSKISIHCVELFRATQANIGNRVAVDGDF